VNNKDLTRHSELLLKSFYFYKVIIYFFPVSTGRNTLFRFKLKSPKDLCITPGMENLPVILQSELIKRCEVNRAYSLRAFAKSLGIPAPTLSQLMSGKRSPSKKNLQKICAQLGLSLDSGKPGVRFQTPNHTWHEVEADVFAMMSQWYHFAILELIKIYKGKITEVHISRRLGIKSIEARGALDRLQRLKLIEKREDIYVDLNAGFASYHDDVNTSVAKRALMGHLLDKAKEQLEQTSMELRDHSSITLAINKKDIKKAKKLIKNFRRDFASLMEQTPKPDQVYELTMAFYPLSKDLE